MLFCAFPSLVLRPPESSGNGRGDVKAAKKKKRRQRRSSTDIDVTGANAPPPPAEKKESLNKRARKKKGNLEKVITEKMAALNTEGEAQK